jgi:diguanylate cyclase (GGDEF)-like protein
MLFARLAGLADHAATALQSVRLVEQMSHHASHDSLTGLANRQKLREVAEHSLARARRTERRVAMLFIDLDRFKNVNDTLGHAAGDELIRQAAERINDVTRPTDVLARLGGDEFLLVLEDVPNGDVARATAQRVVDTLRVPFTLDHQAVYISCSVGIACYPDHGRDFPTLLKHADAAMYEAKASGRNGVAVFSARSGRSRSGTELVLESQLHAAIENDELEVFYQPQFEVTAGEIIGAEALVRWRHPQYGLLEPGSFLSVAEASGLISDIDRVVRAAAFAQARQWQAPGRPFRIAVNLGARDLQSADLADRLLREVTAAGLSADSVEVEITDRIAIDDVALTDILATLRDRGLRVAIDDFGTGTSVLGRLHRCPVQTLKIDRSFIRDIEGHDDEPVVVEALVALARGMGISTVVEGVENVHQLNAVRACGADLAQGFLLSRPVPAEQVTAMLEAGPSVTAALFHPTARVERRPALRQRFG